MDATQATTTSRQKNNILLDLCASALRSGHANFLCIVPILTDDPRRVSRQHFETCVSLPRDAHYYRVKTLYHIIYYKYHMYYIFYTSLV